MCVCPLWLLLYRCTWCICVFSDNVCSLSNRKWLTHWLQMSSIDVFGVLFFFLRYLHLDSSASSLTFAWFFRPGIPAIWLHSNAWKLCPRQASWRTIFLVTRSCCCNWADVKHKPVYVSIFIHRASCVGSESVWPPLLKSNVCKQGPSRKVKTSQPRGKKSPLCWCPLWLLSYPPTLCIWVQPADSCTVSPKCLYRIWSTLLSAKYKWFIQ